MQYRKLGSSGVRVSEISLGSWLTFGHSVTQDVTNRCVKKALELGINLIDTADVYAQGACEEALGKALAEYPRKDYVLATKCFFPTGPGENDRGLSRKHMRESLDASLRRLRTSYIDLYQCHRMDPETPLQEIVRTMDDFVRQGKILYWGVSYWSPEMIVEVKALADKMNAVAPITNQPPYNMLERGIENGVIAASDANGMSQIVFSPLAQGLLTGKYRGGARPTDARAADDKSNSFILTRMTPENLARVDRVLAIAQREGWSPAQLALAWCLRKPNVASVIIGATKIEQIVENVGATGKKLSRELEAEIEAALR